VIDRPKEPPTFGGDDDEEDFDDPFGVERPTSPAEAMPEERPTVSPPFDVEAYARASEAKVRAARTPAPAVIGGEVSTKPPPPSLDFEPEEEFSSADRPRPPQITLTDEGEIEEARLRSAGSAAGRTSVTTRGRRRSRTLRSTSEIPSRA
jgi:hypothetical protein